jgi:hypothetical protein
MRKRKIANEEKTITIAHPDGDEEEPSTPVRQNINGVMTVPIMEDPTDEFPDHELNERGEQLFMLADHI